MNEFNIRDLLVLCELLFKLKSRNFHPITADEKNLSEKIKPEIISVYNKFENVKKSVLVAKSKNNKTLLLTFRSTTGDVNLNQDLDIVPFMISPNIYIHNGYYEHYLNVSDTILQYVDDHIKNDGTDIVFNGYSLGATAATLCAYFFKEKYPKINMRVSTFGGPPIGNKNFVKDFKHRLGNNNQRITHYKDPVPTLSLGIYKHVNINLYKFLKNKLVKKENNIKCCFPLFQYIKGNLDYKYHSLEEYRIQIEKYSQ
jgi:hypothetical protein